MKLVISFLLGMTLLLILGLFALSFFDKSETPQISTYSKTDDLKPKLEIADTYYDLGTINVKNVATKDFVVKNSGQKPLQLSNVNSNCGCTSAKIISEGVETKESGMHRISPVVTEVAPGTEVTVRVIYRPFTMPVYGVVTREVYLDTNDPNLSKLILRIKANVK